MSAQPDIDIAAAPDWSAKLNVYINGAYPLRRLLSGSEHGAVFLTECQGRADPAAAIKIIPIERVTLSQLSHWKLATGLAHPHLIQLLDAGLCQLGGHQFLFVVMEHAEQSLSEVLRQRALTPEEVVELLPPALDALSFLHRKGFVHGHLKPENFLVVADQLKLSSDGILPAGAPRVGIAEPSVYHPPEASSAGFTSAGDIWGLGVTLVEALTQHPPTFGEQSATGDLPSAVSPALAETVQRCLNADHATRPSASELHVQFGGAPQEPVVPTPQPALPTASEDVRPVPMIPALPELPALATVPVRPERRALMPRVAVIVSAVLLAAIWAGWQFFHTHPKTTASVSPAEVPAVAAQQPPAPIPTAPAPAAPSAVHQQLPNVPRKALGTIHGHFRIVALVVVDSSGNVISEHLKSTGPSSYFARLTKDAAKQWKFTATVGPGTHEWLLRFEFTRGGVTAEATPAS